MEESQMAMAMQVVPCTGIPPVGLNFRPSSAYKPFTLFCCFSAKKRIFPVTHHTRGGPLFLWMHLRGLPFLLANRVLRGGTIRWDFQDDLCGHGTEDDLEWEDTVSMESRTVISINKDLTKGSTQEERREARSRSKFYRTSTGCLMDVGTAGKGKVKDDLDLFSTVSLNLPTINVQLTFAKWRRTIQLQATKTFSRERYCLLGQNFISRTQLKPPKLWASCGAQNTHLEIESGSCAMGVSLAWTFESPEKVLKIPVSILDQWTQALWGWDSGVNIS